MDDYFVCPNCGAEVSPKAKACPECGVNAVLIGETLMRATDIIAKIRELFS